MKRLGRFLKIAGSDAGNVALLIAVIVGCIALFVAVVVALSYGIGGLAGWIMGYEFVSLKDQIFDGLAVFMLIAVPSFFLFLVVMSIIYFCKWIAISWLKSGEG